MDIYIRTPISHGKTCRGLQTSLGHFKGYNLATALGIDIYIRTPFPMDIGHENHVVAYKRVYGILKVII